MDRRALVFVAFAAVSLALYPLADHYDGSHGWRWGSEGWAFVPVLLGVVYLLLAALSWLDHRSHQKLDARPLGYDRHDLAEVAEGVPGVEIEGDAPDGS